jgi:hypothetical protein
MEERYRAVHFAYYKVEIAVMVKICQCGCTSATLCGKCEVPHFNVRTSTIPCRRRIRAATKENPDHATLHTENDVDDVITIQIANSCA